MWLYNSPSAELTEVPLTDPETIAGLVTTDRIDAAHLLDRQFQAAFPRVGQPPAAGSSGGLTQTARGPSGAAWSDIDTAAFGTGTSVTVWTGLPTRDYFIGAELPSAAISALLPAPLSTLPDTYQVLLSPSGRWLSAGAAASTDLSLPNGYEGTPARVPRAVDRHAARPAGTDPAHSPCTGSPRTSSPPPSPARTGSWPASSPTVSWRPRPPRSATASATASTASSSSRSCRWRWSSGSSRWCCRPSSRGGWWARCGRSPPRPSGSPRVTSTSPSPTRARTRSACSARPWSGCVVRSTPHARPFWRPPTSSRVASPNAPRSCATATRSWWRSTRSPPP